MKLCPNCKEPIHDNAISCPNCLKEVIPINYNCPRCNTSCDLTDVDFYIECQNCSLTFDKKLFGRIPESRILAREEMRDILTSSNQLSYEDTMTLIHYCQFYQEELKDSNDLEIIYDMQPLIKRLLNQGDYNDSYWILSHTYLLQGQLSLLEMNMGEAQRNITKAQEIAEDHELQLLAHKISNEHDKLLKELDKWQSFKKREPPMAERLKLVSLDETINSLQRKRKIEPIDVTNEEPVLLLIIAGGGVPLFSFPFSEEWKFDDELFGSFLTAFNTFSDEIFSEGLDRVRFGSNTLLMESVGDFSVCYLFKGQTYRAKQKLVRFVKEIKENSSIWQKLINYYKTSRVLETRDSRSLTNLIDSLFLT